MYLYINYMNNYYFLPPGFQLGFTEVSYLEGKKCQRTLTKSKFILRTCKWMDILYYINRITVVFTQTTRYRFLWRTVAMRFAIFKPNQCLLLCCWATSESCRSRAGILQHTLEVRDWFVRLDSEHAQSNGKSVNRGLPELDLARGRDFQCWPKGSRPLGTRMDRPRITLTISHVIGRN